MRERDIERHLVKRVKAIGGQVRKVQWIGRMHAPDRLVMLPARNVRRVPGNEYPTFDPACAVWVELKAPGEVVRHGQWREHCRMLAYGMQVVVIDSIEGVEALLA